MNWERSDADRMADAREYLEKNGWWRGSLVGPNGRQVCGMGAVAASQGWLVHDMRGQRIVAGGRFISVQRIVSKVMTANGENKWDFVYWNDHIALDKQAVLDAFAKAEKVERAGFDPDKGASW